MRLALTLIHGFAVDVHRGTDVRVRTTGWAFSMLRLWELRTSRSASRSSSASMRMLLSLLEVFRVKLLISDHAPVIAPRSATILRSEGRLLGL